MLFTKHCTGVLFTFLFVSFHQTTAFVSGSTSTTGFKPHRAITDVRSWRRLVRAGRSRTNRRKSQIGVSDGNRRRQDGQFLPGDGQFGGAGLQGAGGSMSSEEGLHNGPSATPATSSASSTSSASPPSTTGGRSGGAGVDELAWSQLGTERQKRVFVCTNRWCTEKGSSATLGSFVGLAPEGEVLVQGVNCLGKCNKGPNVRVRQENGKWCEFNRIDSVESVYKILRDYLGADVSKEAALCLMYNFLANGALDRNEVTRAIGYYDKAIATGYVDQQGVLLVMRATAFMQRAYSHWRGLNDLLQEVMVDMPTQQMLQALDQVWGSSTPRARAVILGMFATECEERGRLYQKTKFRYGLYEFALLRACEDALRATETLPNYARCWLKAGDALSALRKPKEAAGYYRVALDLDPSMDSYIRSKIDALKDGNGDALASFSW